MLGRALLMLLRMAGVTCPVPQPVVEFDEVARCLSGLPKIAGT